MEAIASRLWKRRREGSRTRAALHDTSLENRLFSRPRQSDRECPINHPMPKRQITCISSRHLQLLPRLPPLQLPLHRCLHQPSPHQQPRRYQTPPTSIPDRVVRELGHETDVYMPGRSRGETRAVRYSHHSMGLMSHAALAHKWHPAMSLTRHSKSIDCRNWS